MVKLAVPGVEQAVCATGCELMDGVVFTVSATLVEVAAAWGAVPLTIQSYPAAAATVFAVVSVDKESVLVVAPETVDPLPWTPLTRFTPFRRHW